MSGGSSSSSGFDEWRTRDGATKPTGPNGGGDGGGGGADRCAIYETTVLASPVARVVPTLNLGDLLTVALETSPRNRIVVRTNTGAVAGAITSVNLVEVNECMQAGFTYEAEVKSISGGRIEVEISPA